MRPKISALTMVVNQVLVPSEQTVVLVAGVTFVHLCPVELCLEILVSSNEMLFPFFGFIEELAGALSGPGR